MKAKGVDFGSEGLFGGLPGYHTVSGQAREALEDAHCGPSQRGRRCRGYAYQHCPGGATKVGSHGGRTRWVGHIPAPEAAGLGCPWVWAWRVTNAAAVHALCAVK